MKYIIASLLFIFIGKTALSQTIMYVNADTLGIKEFPDRNAKTLLFLHPPCKVKVDTLKDESYEGFNEIKQNWYAVKFFISDGSWTGGTTISGYLPKRYLVEKLSMLEAPVDTSITIAFTNLNEDKPHVIEFKRSSRGLCYYYNSFRIKEYVDEKFCLKQSSEVTR